MIFQSMRDWLEKIDALGNDVRGPHSGGIAYGASHMASRASGGNAGGDSFTIDDLRFGNDIFALAKNHIQANLPRISPWIFIDLRYNSSFRAQRNP
jgi:hypothetical protein